MSAANVVFLDKFGNHRPIDNPTQLDLFGQTAATHKTFCLVDIRDLTQETLIKSVMRNAIDTIVDLRPVPVFSRPKFDHHEITTWLSRHSVSYIEYAVAVYDPKTFAEIDRRYELNDRTSRFSLWIYDEQSKEIGWLDKVRSELRRSNLFEAEITPRSLLHAAGAT